MEICSQLFKEISENLVSATFAKPAVQSKFLKVKIHLMDEDSAKSKERLYFAEMFTSTQAFQKRMNDKELAAFLEENVGINFKHSYIEETCQKYTFLTNKKGKTTVLTSKIKDEKSPLQGDRSENTKTDSLKTDGSFSSGLSSPRLQLTKGNRKKNYIIQEGKPVPFLIHLGVMNKEGKVLAPKYDKFKQINRFLEYIRDIVPVLQENTNQINKENPRPLRIIDFGCGKSYLTFAVYHYLHEILHLPVEIAGLDLKDDVITMCNLLAKEFNYKNLHFYSGTIQDYFAKLGKDEICDLVITLHACDTATDYALASAIQQKAKAILSVPCCQHELNTNFKETVTPGVKEMLNYGIVKERFLALTTDVMRCELLEQNGYSCQLLEFIDMSHTPKNILIRAVRKDENSQKSAEKTKTSGYENLAKMVGEDISLAKLLKNNVY